MDKSKRPITYVAELDLQGIKPLVYEVDMENKSSEPKANGYEKRERQGQKTDEPNANGYEKKERQGQKRQRGRDGYYNYWDSRESRRSQGHANKWSRVR